MGKSYQVRENVFVLPVDMENRSAEDIARDAVASILSWPKKNSSSIQVHGHIHARMDYNERNRAEGTRRFDVGVDANNFFPVSVMHIVDFFERKVDVDDIDTV